MNGINSTKPNLRAFRDYLRGTNSYTITDLPEILDSITEDDIVFNGKSIYYYQIPCSFDIETSSFYEGEEKRACMYIWMLGINGAVIIGRTWEEFKTALQIISERLELSKSRRLLLYVHNLGYEFQFIRKHFTWLKVFSIESRKPCYALTSLGIEFRCSWILSGYSLEKVGEHIRNIPITKKTGQLNYSLVRHSKTPLSPQELEYCIDDVRVVMSYIYDEILKNEYIYKIPLTKTGYVRNYVREQCLGEKYSPKYNHYRGLMSSLRIQSPEEYLQLKRGFQGGFTHCCAYYSGENLEDVSSDDFTSSYPAQIVSKPYPMSSSEIVHIKSKEEFIDNLKYYCCLFDIEFIGLKPKIYDENYLSISRCRNYVNPIINNGRVVSADRITSTITEQDYFIIDKFYKFDSFRILEFRRYRRGYLPTDFVKSVLTLYKQKTEFKGIPEREFDLMWVKELLNSCYGMMVTDIIREVIEYDGNWGSSSPDIEGALKKYNSSYSRFSFYPWGIWVCAYGRSALFSGIYEFITGGNKDPEKYPHDYVYSDTDSIKSLHRENHIDYINRYNDFIKRQLYKAMDFHKLPYDMVEPKNIKGEPKLLGVWDYEGKYHKFKSLGAKRYITKSDKGWSLTVSGINKKIAMPYLLDKYGEDVINRFEEGLIIPRNYSGKMTHTYIDNETAGVIEDYLGNRESYHELSSVHLENAEYDLSIAGDYLKYINYIKFT